MKKPYKNLTATGGIWWVWMPEPSFEGAKIENWHLPLEVFQKLKGGRPYYEGSRAYPNEFDAMADYVAASNAH